ncbi:MAG: hypothetical protein CENE_00791 [Candidatus Celerinatantimonas neptuna]|nr:MAG: hypothetical protein CENE_00791 [Candidatus Celerinatantimonas neptuna]
MATQMKNNQFRDEVDNIAQQISQAIHHDFSVRIDTNSDDDYLRKLKTLTNTLLESVEQNILSLKSNQQLLEKQVQERTSRLDLILKGTAVAIWEWDIKNDILEISGNPDAMNPMMPNTHDRFTLENWLQLIHHNDRDKVQKHLQKYISGNTSYINIEYRIQDLYGGYRFIQCRGIGNESSSQKYPTRMAGTLNDQTNNHYIDNTTGLVNQLYLDDVLADDLQTDKSLACIVINITNFSELLESLPRQDYRKLYKQITSLLLKHRKYCELLSSTGKGQYSFLVRQLNSQELSERCHILAKILNQPLNTEHQQLWLHCKVAGVELYKNNLTSADEALNAAQSVMRQLSQYNNYAIYNESYRQISLNRHNIEQWLRQAIHHDWLHIYLQPIVDLKRQCIYGYEALSRIHHPELGIISPAQFIPVAEEVGLIKKLSETIFNKAIELMGDPKLNALHTTPFIMEVNISAAQLHQKSLPSLLIKQLQSVHVSPERLNIELTESAVMQNISAATEIIERFRASNIKVALDDFGTGYSSLAYLRQLPLDILKLDRSIVTGVTEDSQQSAIVEMVMQLATKLGIKVIIEGIETTEELQHLCKLGATSGQGFLFAEPLLPEQIQQAHQQTRELFARISPLNAHSGNV